jgi:hypothetical protein
MSFAHETGPELGPYAEQHLELVGIGSQLVFGDEPPALVEQPLVVGRNADVPAGRSNASSARTYDARTSPKSWYASSGGST